MSKDILKNYIDPDTKFPEEYNGNAIAARNDMLLSLQKDQKIKIALQMNYIKTNDVSRSERILKKLQRVNRRIKFAHEIILILNKIDDEIKNGKT